MWADSREVSAPAAVRTVPFGSRAACPWTAGPCPWRIPAL
jgi:hypothetical protein